MCTDVLLGASCLDGVMGGRHERNMETTGSTSKVVGHQWCLEAKKRLYDMKCADSKNCKCCNAGKAHAVPLQRMEG